MMKTIPLKSKELTLYLNNSIVYHRSEIETLKRNRSMLKMFSTQLESRQIKALKKHKAETGVPTSVTVRRAIDQYLTGQAAKSSSAR